MSAPCPLLGFNVTIVLSSEMSEDKIDDVILDFITTLESHGLRAGGGGERTFAFTIERDGGQATSADRDLVSAWADGWAGFATIAVGDLIDLSAS